MNNSQGKDVISRLNDAIDGLIKIKCLLSAAAFLTGNDDESETQRELYSLVEDVVTRTLEAIK
jgi:hypothetical protein